MRAIITGASSGIGRDMARYLNEKQIDLILVARREERLNELKRELKGEVTIIVCDLTKQEEVYSLYEKLKNIDIDILINNAGFGLFGNFLETDLKKELDMIELNIVSYHILTKLFLKKFASENKEGYILNVCSSAGFLAGPRLSTYYATKNYILKLSLAIYEELRRENNKVSISALCPGPVNTEFNKVANGGFTVKGLSSEYVARYGIDKMFQKKLIIVPSIKMKIGLFLSRFIPWKLLVRILYHIEYQKK